jgi:diadenosine tetraphosphatase ApaH/serine/threonine PP2A family protein phosphatase
MRYLVISDIHSNLEAFKAVLADAGTVDEVWCLGDVVGYGPDPNACVDLLRSLPHRAIVGNHDWATLGKLDLNDFNPDARAANLWNREQLNPANLAYLQALPERLVESSFTLVHGSPRHPIWEYIIYEPTAEANFAYFETPVCLVGHTHTPAIFRQVDSGEESTCEALVPSWHVATHLRPGRWIVNPGSVGQPRDGDPEASYAIIDSEALTVEHRRVAYAVGETQTKMMEIGLPMRLAVRLGYGW